MRVLTKGGWDAGLLGVRVLGKGDEIDESPGELRALTRVGYGSDPGGGQPPPSEMPQLRHVCDIDGP